MRYSTAHIIFHWATALLVFGLAASGMAYSYDLVGNSAMTAHQITGQVLVVLLLARIISRFMQTRSAADENHSLWERALAFLVHNALYICLIAYVVTGYVSASALRDPALLLPVDQTFARSDTGELLLEIHFLLKWALLGLVTLHIGGAMKHALWDRDTTLRKMTFTSTKET